MLCRREARVRAKKLWNTRIKTWFYKTGRYLTARVQRWDTALLTNKEWIEVMKKGHKHVRTSCLYDKDISRLDLRLVVYDLGILPKCVEVFFIDLNRPGKSFRAFNLWNLPPPKWRISRFWQHHVFEFAQNPIHRVFFSGLRRPCSLFDGTEFRIRRK